MKIAIVEDDRDIAELLMHHISKEYEVIHFINGNDFFTYIKNNTIDFLILDLMLPEIDGLEICKLIRQSDDNSSLPILMLTAKTDDIDKIIGLELGADDYMTKPFNIRELLTRIKVIMRRINIKTKSENNDNYSTEMIESRGILLDSSSMVCKIDNHEIELTTTEFKLLTKLISSPGKVYSREKLLSLIWGEDVYISDRTIDVHITQIRKKLNQYSKRIKSIRGIGYKYILED